MVTDPGRAVRTGMPPGEWPLRGLELVGFETTAMTECDGSGVWGGEGLPLGGEWRRVSTPDRTLGRDVSAPPMAGRQTLVHLFTC